VVPRPSSPTYVCNVLVSASLSCYDEHRKLHSFPTRRSSDLPGVLLPSLKCEAHTLLGLTEPQLMLCCQSWHGVVQTLSMRLGRGTQILGGAYAAEHELRLLGHV